MSSEILVKYTAPKPIRLTNLDALIDEAKKMVEDFKDIVATEENLKDVKNDRAHLRNMIASAEQKRKDVKKEWMNPYLSFESDIKKLTEVVKEVADGLDAQIKAIEETQTIQRRQVLVDAYNDYAPMLVPVVPFEKIESPKWSQKSFGERKAIAELESRVNEIAEGLKLIESMATGPYLDRTISTFYDTLDIAKAFAEKSRLEEHDKRVATLEAERKAYAEEVAAPEVEPEIIEVEPEVAEVAAEEIVLPVYRKAVMHLTITRGQAALIGQFLKDNNIEYRSAWAE